MTGVPAVMETLGMDRPDDVTRIELSIQGRGVPAPARQLQHLGQRDPERVRPLALGARRIELGLRGREAPGGATSVRGHERGHGASDHGGHAPNRNVPPRPQAEAERVRLRPERPGHRRAGRGASADAHHLRAPGLDSFREAAPRAVRQGHRDLPLHRRLLDVSNGGEFDAQSGATDRVAYQVPSPSELFGPGETPPALQTITDGTARMNLLTAPA